MSNGKPLSNEVMATELKNVYRQLDDIKSLLNTMSDSFVSHAIFELRMKELEEKITSNKIALQRAENRRNFINWVLPTVSAGFGALFTYLIIEFFNARR